MKPSLFDDLDHLWQPCCGVQIGPPEAILSLALGFRKVVPWHWNRFIVPLERGSQGILAGHAVLGVQKPGAAGSSPSPKMVKEVLKRRKVESLTPFRLPQKPGPNKEQRKFLEMRDKQLGVISADFSRFIAPKRKDSISAQEMVTLGWEIAVQVV